MLSAKSEPSLKDESKAFEIRALNPSDLPRVLEIERASFPDPWSVEAFRGVFHSKFYITLGIFQERLLGYIIALWVVDELHILNIAVEPGSRRMGLGGTLLDTLLNGFKSRMKFAHLEVRASNSQAIGFYEKRGFKTVGTRKGYYPNGEDALLMSLEVDANAYLPSNLSQGK